MNLSDDGIYVKGAREHNLKNIDVHIPRNQVTVITGLSGSGKSSLAFDTIYAEGQRRYVESLSAYARNFLEQLKKPDVDSIFGLSPAISIEQKTSSTNPRSTVGTVTEIYDLLRLIYSKVGVPRCPTHKEPLSSQLPSQIVNEVMSWPKGTKVNIYSPIVRSKKGEFLAEFKKWLKKGFIRARIDGMLTELESATRLTKTKNHDIELLIDRLILGPDVSHRLAETVNLALKMADGFVLVENLSEKKEHLFSLHSVCKHCGFTFPEIEPRLLSFNNPKGSCPDCNGLGFLQPDDPEASSDSDDSEVQDEKEEHDFETCATCGGYRLREEALNIMLHEKNIGEVTALSIAKFNLFFKQIPFSERDLKIIEKAHAEVLKRTKYLVDLGLGYLSLSRSMRTLSGGEAQRIRLASQLGSSLVGVLYVLDEPSIGLHPRDHHRLLQTLQDLKNLGNTIVLVEHDKDTIMSADHIIDLGPRAGILGGEIQAEGTPKEILKNPKSITGKYLSGEFSAHIPTKNKDFKATKTLRLKGAIGNNLKNVDLEIPIGAFTTVTGVSGSGKSTLVIDTLYRALASHFNKSPLKPAAFKSIDGLEFIQGVVNIDQKPIGRTPRSNPSTYVGLFSQIRDLFSQVPDAKLRGYKPGRFSFNVKGGRCESCEGAGLSRIEMHFLADVFVQCDVCQGQRYNRETLAIKYRDKSIAEVLSMSVLEAHKFFEHHSLIFRKIDTLMRVGLDYISLGQSSTTLSGGEAQRIKLSKELSRKGAGQHLYILDEPTTGLHFEDVKKLIELLHLLIENGNTVLVIEHNTDVIKSSHHVIDIGPEGGDAGGEIIAFGSPREISKFTKSHTGKFL